MIKPRPSVQKMKPYSPPLEAAITPDAGTVVAAIERVMQS